MLPLGLLLSTSAPGNSSARSKLSTLRNFSEARSTDFTLRPSNGCEILGKVLADPTLPEPVRDLLQAHSFCCQTSSPAVVSRNHRGTWSMKCKLCKKDVDTYAHLFMQCPELHRDGAGLGHAMHDTIARPEALLHFITEPLRDQGNIPLRVEQYIGELVDAIMISPRASRRFTRWHRHHLAHSESHPLSKHPSRVVIFDFKFASCSAATAVHHQADGAGDRGSLYTDPRGQVGRAVLAFGLHPGPSPGPDHQIPDSRHQSLCPCRTHTQQYSNTARSRIIMMEGLWTGDIDAGPGIRVPRTQ
eukprot:1057958-Rhodomonas_salina.5